MNLDDARERADRLVELLAPACIRIEIAGSIRREKAAVKDIEIVVIPRARLAAYLNALPPDGPLRWQIRPDTGRRAANGQRYKRLEFEGVKVDLFLASAENWGCILAIRTGDAEFSQFIVTPLQYGGAMPRYLCQRDGSLHDIRTGESIACPEEDGYFRAIGIPTFHPRWRNAEGVALLRRLLLPRRKTRRQVDANSES